MQSSLGIYIEDNLIKYAKVSKNNEEIKIDSFGIKFYDKIEETIKQIIEETYSYKVPISTNLPEENYNYFDVFGGLKKKDIDGIIKTSFENYCYDAGLSKESYEARHIYTSSSTNKEKIRAIHVSSKKTSIAIRKNQLSGYRINGIFPTSVAVHNLLKQNQKQTCLILNLEKNTTITKIDKDGIKDIKLLPMGSKNVFDKIKSKENSYAKAYEICKNSTIYTNDAKDLQIEENEFLTDIMPTLFEIVNELKNYLEQNFEGIETIYITGTLSVINNIDIYFQEYIKSSKIEILKPYFISSNSKINIKEYIEVNSALALALQSLGAKYSDINFSGTGGGQKVFNSINQKISIPKLNELDFTNTLENLYRPLVTATSVLTTVLIVYIISIITVNTMLEKKNKDVQETIQDTKETISQIEGYDTKLNNRITKYNSMITAIEEKNKKIEEDRRYRNLIPNLLNNLMAIIPKEVQLESISNPNATHVIIEAKSKKYEQLAYFKTKITYEKVLKDVVSDAGVASDAVADETIVQVTIEGELP